MQDSATLVSKHLESVMTDLCTSLSDSSQILKNADSLFTEHYSPILGDSVSSRFVFLATYIKVNDWLLNASLSDIGTISIVYLFSELVDSTLGFLSTKLDPELIIPLGAAYAIPDFFDLHYRFLHDLLANELGLPRERINKELYLKWFQATPASMLFGADSQVHPESAADLWEAGVNASNQGDYESAVQLLQKGLEIEPNNILILNSLGFVYHETDDYESALSCFNLALEIKADDGLILKNRGMVKVALKDYESALEDLDRAVSLSPDLWTAVWFRSRAQEELSQYEQAIVGLSTYLESHPECHQIFERRARVRWGKAIQEEALDDINSNMELIYDINSAVLLDPDNVEYRITAGHIYDSFSDYIKGIEFYSQALAMEPTSVEALFSRAKNYACMDECESSLRLALADLDRASELDPGNLQLIGYRCQIKADLNDFEGALADCDVLEDPIYADRQRILVLEKQSDHELSTFNPQNALTAISKAIEIQESPSLLRKRALIHDQLVDSERELVDLSRASELEV